MIALVVVYGGPVVQRRYDSAGYCLKMRRGLIRRGLFLRCYRGAAKVVLEISFDSAAKGILVMEVVALNEILRRKTKGFFKMEFSIQDLGTGFKPLETLLYCGAWQNMITTND